MARRKQLDIQEIIAKNPKVNRTDLNEGAEVLKALQKSGAVRPSTYELETDRSRNIRYCEDEVVIIRGATIRLAD